MKKVLSTILILTVILTGVWNYSNAQQPEKQNTLQVEEVDFGPYMSKMQKEIKWWALCHRPLIPAFGGQRQADL